MAGTPAFFLILLSIVPRLVSSQETFIIDNISLEPVDFNDKVTTDTVPLQMVVPTKEGLFIESKSPVECTSRDEWPKPFGSAGILNVKAEKNWQIRLGTKKDYYLKIDPAPSKINIYVQFGDRTCGKPLGSQDGTATLLEHPNHEEGGEFSTVESSDGIPHVKVSPCDGDQTKAQLVISIELKTEGSCNILDRKEHDLIFNVNTTLSPGNYAFKPCFAFMKFEGDKSVEYKHISDAPGSKDRNLAERFLQDEEPCYYCDPGEECVCCPSPQSVEETRENNAWSKPIRGAVAVAAFGAIVTALAL